MISYFGLLIFTLVLYFRPQQTYPALASVPGGHAEGFENTFRELYRAVYRDPLTAIPYAALLRQPVG